MRQIPFYSETEADDLAWQRAAVSCSSATEKRYDSLLAAAIEHAKHGYWSSRWALRNPARCANLVGENMRVALARRKGAEVELDGVKIKLQPEYSLRLARALIARTYASAERQLVRRALEDGDVVMEVGSGIGVIAALCARRLGSDRIVAFEAHPAMIRAARHTFALNGISPRLEHCALGCVAGPRVLYAGAALGDTRRSRKLNVPGRTLAEALRVHRPTFLIIDAEGGERELIRAAIAHGVPKVLISFHPQLIGTATVERAQRALACAGYVPIDESACRNHVLYRRNESAPTVIDTPPAA